MQLLVEKKWQIANNKTMKRPKDMAQTLPTETDQARIFSHVRNANDSEVTEDYVELIADLLDSQGEARAVDIAKRMGVTGPTVNKALARLVKEGLIDKQPYRSIFLTTAGRELAEKCKSRHVIVRDFLLSLGISKAVAERDAEGIEHHVSAETLQAMKAALMG